jgi:glycosyltransferase involved in cell wall biosynthesis
VKNKKFILHISAHFGGGVGSIIKGWIDNDKDNTHTLSYLNDIHENKNQYSVLFKKNIIPDYDFVLCHIWNHPAMFEFLTSGEISECRLLGWSHMSGLYPPYILFDKLINFFDAFYYTSHISNLTGIERETIWSSCDIEPFLKIKKKSHQGFNIGYVGTIDFCKLYPRFVDICCAINIPDVQFIIVGEGCDLDVLKWQVKSRGLTDKFLFTGLVKDTIPYLEQFDIFLYPLNFQHGGTCEQVLGEAMAAGLPCVVFNNPAERFIIQNKKLSGFICYDENDIVDIVRMINKNLNFGDIGDVAYNARERAKELYSVENKIKQWNNVFDKFYFINKRKRIWKE